MAFEKSAGAVIFRRQGNKIEYFLLNYPSQKGGHWDFPKGHIEKGEKALDTVRREVKEETGFDNKILDGFKGFLKYFFRDRKNPKETVFKIVDFYLAEVPAGEEAKLSFEHVGFEWLPYEEALARITYKGSKQILEKASKFLTDSALATL
jgi:8-oxo-dGTP pyrophosphatase MutT (NUDIX family)